jgi:hypothetical protein
MVHFSTEVTLALLAIGGIAGLAILSTLASLIRNATMIHDLQVSAAALRINYAKQLAGADEEVIKVDEVVEEAPAPPTP